MPKSQQSWVRPTISDTVKFESRQMKQCWITYIKRKTKKNSPLTSAYPKILQICARNGSTIRKAGMPTWFLHQAPPPAPIKCPFSYTCQPSHKNTNWTAHSATRSGAEGRCKTAANLPLCFSHRLESSVDWRWPLSCVHPLMIVFRQCLLRVEDPCPSSFTQSTPLELRRNW
jgi:hypothetical protein